MATPEQPSSYYRKVAAYYDEDAPTFESRARQNPVLQRIRQSFRDLSAPYLSGQVLEIGCGPGLDLLYWAQAKPELTLYGIDVSPGMLERARANIAAAGLANVHTGCGSIEHVAGLFPNVRFQALYCYFGALNTTEHLPRAAQAMQQLLLPGGSAILTFVNRWYGVEILYGLLRGRWRQAFARLRPVWGGYAGGGRFLESSCYSPADIRRGFAPEFQVIGRRGYSILYPAWYRNPRRVQRWGQVTEALWQVDQWLNRTPLWALGEYALYILQARGPAR